MTSKKDINIDLFKAAESDRKAEQEEIERIGVYGEAEHHETAPEKEENDMVVEEIDVLEDIPEETEVVDVTAEIVDMDSEGFDSENLAGQTIAESVSESKQHRQKKTKKPAKIEADPMVKLTLSLPKSVVKGLKIMQVEKEEKSVSSMVENWYLRNK